MHMKFLLVGNYGVGNVGDEALREYFLYKFPNVDWKVVSAKPSKEELSRLPLGFRSFIATQWPATLLAIWKSDGIVFGGGSLFTDIESWRACALWWWHAFWAWMFGKKVVLAFQGIGPFRTSIGAMLTKWVVRRAVYISVRDAHSFARVKKWNPSVKIVESFDPVFSACTTVQYKLDALKNLILIPRANSSQEFIEHAQTLVDSGRWQQCICISLQPDSALERHFILQLRQRLSTPMLVIQARTLPELTSAVAQGSFVLSQRYHGAIVAMALGRELQVLPQYEDDKIASIATILTTTPLHSRVQHLQQLVEAGELSMLQYIQ